MAARRLVGPLLAGIVLDVAEPWVLATLAGGLIGAAALTVGIVGRSSPSV